MRIHRATASDLDEVQRLIERLSLKSMEEGDPKTGFLLPGFDRAEFSHLAFVDGWLWIARSEDGGLAGFALFTPGSGLLRRHPTTTMTWEESSNQSKWQNLLVSGDFLYCDQVGVAPEHAGTGIAKALLAEAVRTLKPKAVLALVVEAPLNNERSHTFFSKQGYEKIARFFTPSFRSVAEVESVAYLIRPAA